MLDPITALGIASNIAQFVDFGLKATSKAREIYQAVDGSTTENADLELITKDLVALNAQLYASVGSGGETEALEELCERCAKTADELLTALESFKVKGNKTRWKSTRKALKSLWGREGVEEIKSRLLGFREELKLHFLVRLKGELDLLAVQQSTRFNELDDKAKEILNTLIASREMLSQSLQEQAEASERQHSNSREFVEIQHNATRSGIVQAVSTAAASIDTQFQFMRREMEAVNNAVAKNQRDTTRILEELKGISQALARARTDKQRKKLQERSNLATETLYALISVYKRLTTLLENLKVQAAALMASIGFARLWKSQEEASAPFSFQKAEPSTSNGTKIRQEDEDLRQRRTAVLCSNYYYYYFPLCRRRHIVQKQRIQADLHAIHPVDDDVHAQFPNLPLLLALTQAEWQPNFSWAVKEAVEIPFLFHLPTPSVAYDFLSVAIAFSAVMPQVTGETQAETVLADLFGNSTHLSSPPGSAQRQRIKNDYKDWQKIAGLLWLDELYITCHEESCQLWQVEPASVRLEAAELDADSEPLLVRFWLWLMGGWQTYFSFEVPYNPHTDTSNRGVDDTANTEFVLVYSVAEFLVRSSYHINLKIERDARTASTLAKVSFLGAQSTLPIPPPAVVQQRRGSMNSEV